jgi:lipoprotein signal peptidase
MFMLYAILIGLVVGLALGGRLSNLGDLEFRWWQLALGGLIVQLVLFSPVAEGIGSAGPVVYVASTALVAVAVLRNVRQNAGFAVVASGALCNLVAIVANGGFMPVTPEALVASGRTVVAGYSNSIASSRPALEALVDRFVLPPGLPWHNVFSVGDVLIAVGIVVIIVTVMRKANSADRVVVR